MGHACRPDRRRPDGAAIGTVLLSPEAARQPDQDPALWDRYVADYERVFEPLTDTFAACALDALEPLAGARLLDLCAGAGGAALLAARRGASVTALDASPRMVERIRARATGLAVAADVADAAALALPDGGFDAALSCFGLVLLADPLPALRALGAALGPGRRVAVVTWTDPHLYELASRIGAAVAAVRPPSPSLSSRRSPPPGPPPAQLRFANPEAFVALMDEGGFPQAEIVRLEARLTAPSAVELSRDLAFAPGLGALMGSLGPDRPAVEAAFARALEADQGPGPVSLGAVAHMAVGRRSA